MAQYKAKVEDALVGKYFHSFDESGVLHWQGRVHAHLFGEFYLVLLFEWLGGESDDYRIISLPAAEQEKWHFYDTVEAMRDWYERHPPETR